MHGGLARIVIGQTSVDWRVRELSCEKQAIEASLLGQEPTAPWQQTLATSMETHLKAGVEDASSNKMRLSNVL